MRYSAAVLVAASVASAAPLLNDVPVVGPLLNSGLNDVAEGVDKVADEAKGILNLVWTQAHGNELVNSLSVIDGVGKSLLAHTCANKLTDDIFASIPIDFSKAGKDGLGTFLFDDTIYPIEQTVVNSPLVSCLTHSNDLVTVVRCTVPKVEGLALRAVNDLGAVVNCLEHQIPLLGAVVELLGDLTSVPALKGLDVLNEVPGAAQLTHLLEL